MMKTETEDKEFTLQILLDCVGASFLFVPWLEFDLCFPHAWHILGI